jgi:hypothetical protein
MKIYSRFYSNMIARVPCPVLASLSLKKAHIRLSRVSAQIRHSLFASLAPSSLALQPGLNFRKSLRIRKSLLASSYRLSCLRPAPSHSLALTYIQDADHIKGISQLMYPPPTLPSTSNPLSRRLSVCCLVCLHACPPFPATGRPVATGRSSCPATGRPSRPLAV